jgi:hypothetical protein
MSQRLAFGVLSNDRVPSFPHMRVHPSDRTMATAPIGKDCLIPFESNFSPGGTRLAFGWIRRRPYLANYACRPQTMSHKLIAATNHVHRCRRSRPPVCIREPCQGDCAQWSGSLIPSVQAHAPGTRLAFGWTVAATAIHQPPVTNHHCRRSGAVSAMSIRARHIKAGKSEEKTARQ